MSEWVDLLNALNHVYDNADSNLSATNVKAALDELDTNKGDVVGPGSSTNGNIAIFNGTTGKLLADATFTLPIGGSTGQALAKNSTDNYDWSWQSFGNVTGPTTATADAIAIYNSTSGKLIKDSAILITDLGDVKGPGAAVTDNHLVAWDGVTGKLIKDATYNIPAGGSANQVLKKNSINDYDYSWQNEDAGSGTDLSNSRDASSVTVESSTGANTTIPGADATFAGMLTVSLLNTFNSKEDGLGNPSTDGYVLSSTVDGVRSWVQQSGGGGTDLGQNLTASVVEITSSTGLNTTIQAVDGVNAGVMSTAQLATLNGKIDEAPAVDKSHFRNGSAADWQTNLKAYGDAVQVVASAANNISASLVDGNVLSTTLAENTTINDLTATEASQSATWILRHDGFTVGFNAKFIFNQGTPPEAGAGNTWILGLFTIDSGATWIVTAVEEYTLA